MANGRQMQLSSMRCLSSKVILDMSHIRSDPADAGAKRKGDARLAAIMQFRIQRKRALQQMIERLQKGHSTMVSPINSRAQQEL